MKSLNKLLGILSIILITLSACEKTDEQVPVADRDKFIGTWDGQSTGVNGPRNFSLIISASNSDPAQILMRNFDGGTGVVYASVSGNVFSIPSQQVSAETISGSGNYSGNSLSFSFTVDDGQTTEARTGTATNRR